VRSTIDLVAEFHRATDCPVDIQPTLPSKEVFDLRKRLIEEETRELFEAIEQGNWANILKEISDLQYVLDGTYISLGIDHMKDEAFAEVHRSNMTKVQPDGSVIRDAGGKVQKGPRFEKANMEVVLNAFLP
jgi:predicted HAD superfamily Cof-like phosphohydrolase